MIILILVIAIAFCFFQIFLHNRKMNSIEKQFKEQETLENIEK